MTVGCTMTPCGIECVFGCRNDLGNVDLVGSFGQYVAATWPTHTANQFGTPQFAKQLLQIRQGDVLPLTDGIETNGLGLAVDCHIYHGGYGKTPFGGKTHDGFLNMQWTRIVQYPSILVKYYQDSVRL